MAQQTFEEIVAAVKQAESRGKRYAADGKTLTTSPKGALGEMQVMPKTILDPGFGVVPAKDKSPDEIARVGRDYLQAMLGKYGDTEKALVAYNWGPGATDKWLASGAKPEALPAETRTYVQRVKGLLGKDVPRETMAKKEREPLPASLPPMAQAEPKATTVAMASGKSLPDIKSLPASYQAAFALAALADAQDEEDDRVFNENKSTETEEFFANYKPVNKLASLDLSVTPVMMANGGEVTERKDEPFFDAASRTFVDVLTGRRTPITEKDFTAKEQMAMMDAVRRSQARGGKGRVDYEDYPDNKTAGPGYVDIRNTLGGFQYKQMPDGSTVITDKYDFHGPRVAEYEKMGTGEKVLKSAKNALVEFVTSGGGVRDLAGELGRAYVGSKGPDVNIRIPVNRAEGSPKEGERKLDRETMDMLRRQGTSPASLQRVAPPADINSSAAGLPGLMLLADPRIDNTNAYGYVLDSSDDKKNFGMAQAMFLNKSRAEDYPDTIAHETEHLLARQNLGSAANINSKFDELIGNKGISRLNFVRDAVKAAPYLKEKYDLQSSYLDPKMFEYQSKFGLGKNLLYEQLASLAALEQRHKVDLTKDEELRKTLFARPDVRETYNALTGLRQTRLDPRDLPPHTRVPEPGMLDAIKKVFKRADGGPVYRADGSPEEGERLTPQQIERIAAQETAEREAASTAAFIAQKSGIGRKAGPVSQALQSGQGQIEFLKGMTNVPQNILGAPMDISNMIANVYGGGVEKPFMGSEYLKEKSRAAGLGFTPSTDPTLAAFYGAGDLGSNLVNPAGVTRAGVKAAEKTGEAAKMLARDFQQYNQNLAVPGASYAIRNRGTPFLNTPPEINRNGKVTREAMGEADDYADWLSRTFAHSQPALKTWLRDKVGAYLRRDFGTESDQMVQAADAGKKLHFMSPKLTENVPHQLGTDIGISRELEGFPKAGFAKTPQGQKVEEVIDSTIYPLQLQDINSSGLSYKVPKSMQQFVDTNPEMRVSQMGPIDENLKFDELAQAMEKMFKEKEFRAYGESVPMPKEYILTDETLQGLTPAQASNRVANKMEWADKKRAELAGVAIAKDPRIVSHSYDNGSKWISPADLADNPNHAEMVKDIGCAGGWCTNKDTFALDYGSGDNRLNILLDKKFEPRVQITVNNPTPSMRDFATYMSEMGDNSVATKLQTSNYGWNTAGGRNSVGVDALVETELKAMPEYQDFLRQNQATKHITEIKGQFNNADLKNSPYLKQIQDFVKRQGPELQSVDNLDGIKMVDARDHKNRRILGAYVDDNLLNRFLKVNGNSYYADDNDFIDIFQAAKAAPNNAARQIQMNFFEPPAEKAHGGMIERQPTDNRRYL